MAHDIFISHSSTDEDIAYTLCHILEKNNLKCWIAPRDVSSGNLAEEIFKAIDDGIIIVLVFSKHAQQSNFVNEEITHAYFARKPIISFIIDDTLPERNFKFPILIFLLSIKAAKEFLVLLRI